MFQLMQWAARWGVPLEAIRDLESQMGLYSTEPGHVVQGTSEAAVQAHARLEAAKLGARLLRNNSGAYDPKHPPSPGTRWGLGNESKAQNEVMKSSDLIGLLPGQFRDFHTLEPVTVGQFWAVEVKERGWQYTGTPRERAQLAFGELVIKFGGRFQFYAGGPLV